MREGVPALTAKNARRIALDNWVIAGRAASDARRRRGRSVAGVHGRAEERAGRRISALLGINSASTRDVVRGRRAEGVSRYAADARDAGGGPLSRYAASVVASMMSEEWTMIAIARVQFN